MSSDQEQATKLVAKEGPPSKKLRSTEPDLTIILKYQKDNTEDKNENEGEGGQKNSEMLEKRYPMYSQQLCLLSRFVDTALSVEMQEKQTHELIFEGIAPDKFEKAMTYLESPSSSRDMKPEDVFDVVEFYDKYEFQGGIELCDKILSEYLKFWEEKDNMTPPENLDLLVDIVACTGEYNLENSKKVGTQYVTRRITNATSRFGGIMFTRSHVKKLQLLFVEGAITFDGPAEDWDRAKLESPLFPDFLVCMIQKDYGEAHVKEFTLSGTNCGLDAPIVFYDIGDMAEGFWNGNQILFSIRREINVGDDWAIVAWDNGVSDFLWKSPNSKNIPYPPEGPWLPISPLAKGEPTIKYNEVRVTTGWR